MAMKASEGYGFPRQGQALTDSHSWSTVRLVSFVAVLIYSSFLGQQIPRNIQTFFGRSSVKLKTFSVVISVKTSDDAPTMVLVLSSGPSPGPQVAKCVTQYRTTGGCLFPCSANSCEPLRTALPMPRSCGFLPGRLSAGETPSRPGEILIPDSPAGIQRHQRQVSADVGSSRPPDICEFKIAHEK